MEFLKYSYLIKFAIIIENNGGVDKIETDNYEIQTLEEKIYIYYIYTFFYLNKLKMIFWTFLVFLIQIHVKCHS